MKIPHDTQIVVTAVADDRLRVTVRRNGQGEVTWEEHEKKPLPSDIGNAAKLLAAAVLQAVE